MRNAVKFVVTLRGGSTRVRYRLLIFFIFFRSFLRTTRRVQHTVTVMRSRQRAVVTARLRMCHANRRKVSNTGSGKRDVHTRRNRTIDKAARATLIPISLRRARSLELFYGAGAKHSATNDSDRSSVTIRWV